VPLKASFWSGRRVLVTGHTGFKGSWLSLWLQRLGAEVSGFAPAPPTEPSLYGAAAVATGMAEDGGDVRDPEQVAEVFRARRPEVVFHLAAQPLVRRSLLAPRLTYEINVMGTVNVLEAVRLGEGVRAVVIVTSDKCYANPDRGAAHRLFDEDAPMGGSDPYSSSKGAAEIITAAYRESYFLDDGGPRVATARAGNVIGGGDWGEDRLVADLIRAAEHHEPIRLRNPGAVRPWQHVLNPLHGYLLLAQSLHDDGAFATGWNFGPDPDDLLPVHEVAERLAALWPERLSWTRDERPQPPEAGFLALDSSRARERLGWRPGWDLEQALGRIVEWHRGYANGADPRRTTLEQIDQFPT
jgi:CDP-glucose 4,6-dehydratase